MQQDLNLLHSLDNSTTLTFRKRPYPSTQDSYLEDYKPQKKHHFQMIDNSINFCDTIGTNNSMIGYKCTQQYNTQKIQDNTSLMAKLFNPELLCSGQTKVQKFKQLLPIQLTSTLSANCEQLLKIAAIIDEFLMTKKVFEKMDSLININEQIEQKLNISVDLRQIKQICFISQGYYSLFVDPLKNMVIGLPISHSHLSTRKKILRMGLYDYSQKIKDNEAMKNGQVNIPQFKMTQNKISNFFPKIIRKNKKQICVSSLKIQFIQQIKKELFEKEEEIIKSQQIQKTLSSTTTKQSNIDIIAFINDLQKLFNRYSVSNIYRPNITDYFKKKGILSQTVQSTLAIIQKTGVFLYSKSTPAKPIIYSLQMSEKQHCLQLLSASSNQ